MAALNRQLTEDEARQLINQWRSMTSIPSFYDVLVEALQEPTPHYVRYHHGRYTYTPPELIFVREGPSDCVWIVPGTYERKI